MIEVPERFRLVPIISSRLPQPNERHDLVAGPDVERFASRVLSTELNVAGEKLTYPPFRVFHPVIIDPVRDCCVRLHTAAAQKARACSICLKALASGAPAQ